MELVSTMEINGEEREIADAYARGQCGANAEGIAGLNNNLDTLKYGENAGGKNYCNYNIFENGDKAGLTYTKIDNGIHVTGTAYDSSIKWIHKFTVPKYGSYVISISGNSNIQLIISSDYSQSKTSITKTFNAGQVVDVGLKRIDDIETNEIVYIQIEEGTTATEYETYIPSVKMLADEVKAQNDSLDGLKSDLSKQCKKDDITTNETLIGTFNGKNYYRKLFTGISGSGGSVTVNVGGKIEIYNYYGRAYTYGQSGASDVKYPIPNKNYYIDSQNASETSFQLTIPTSSDTRKVDLVIEYTKVDE